MTRLRVSMADDYSGRPMAFGVADQRGSHSYSTGDRKTSVANCIFRRYFWLSMDTRFVETFLMAVDNGSIAEAARRLNVTPAAAAKRIRALESEVGAVLVRRSGRTIKPTEAGAAIVSRARSFLSEARDFKSLAAINRPSGQLHLGAFQSALTGLLPNILALMEKAYPQIDVRITRGTSTQLYRRMLDGDLDAAIITRPPFAIPKSCDWQLLREEPLILLTQAPAPSRRPHAVLASEPFIRLN